MYDRRGNLAEWTGLEPATPGVTGRYSNRLNYHSARGFQASSGNLEVLQKRSEIIQGIVGRATGKMQNPKARAGHLFL